jgi:hypothetical protein
MSKENVKQVRTLSILEEKILKEELNKFVDDLLELVINLNDTVKKFQSRYENLAMDRHGKIRSSELEKFLKQVVNVEVDSAGVRFVLERYDMGKKVPDYILEKLIDKGVRNLLDKINKLQ